MKQIKSEHFKYIRIFILIFTAVIILYAFLPIGAKQKTTAYRVENVQTEVLKDQLFYHGKVNPLHHHLITTPVAGQVKNIFTYYGQPVQPGDKLFLIESDSTKKSFADKAINHIKNRNKLMMTMKKMNSDKILWDKGAISRQDYDNTCNEYTTDMISYHKTKLQVSKMAGLLGLSLDQIENSDPIKLNELLETNPSIIIKSKHTGTLLSPLVQNKNGKVSTIELGSIVDDNQALATVGDKTGLSIKVLADEADINTLSIGQSASITGDGFEGISLIGTITSKELLSEADNNSNSAQHTKYPIIITVPKLTLEQQAKIQIGMNVRIEITLHSENALLIPIEAIKISHGNTYVNKISSSGKLIPVQVKTGKTTSTQVSITSGLAAGDKVAVYNDGKTNHNIYNIAHD